MDAGQASQHSSKIMASHQEIPSAGNRARVLGTAGKIGGEFYSRFQSHVDSLSTQVGQFQEDVAQTVSIFENAASSQVEHDSSVKGTLTKLASSLGSASASKDSGRASTD